jgi:biopolymer transport protein ExbD
MQFVVRQRRQQPAVIIVALIDILIVLLIFLIVSTTFKQQPSLKLTLPESKQAKTGVAETARVIIVEIDKQAPYLRLDGKAVTQTQLQQEFQARARQIPMPAVAIRADAKAPFEEVIRVMDVAREVGLTNFSAFVRGAK